MHTDISSSPIVMALKLRSVEGVPHIGAAFADATNRHLGVAEFADNDLFSNVEVSCNAGMASSTAHLIENIAPFVTSRRSLCSSNLESRNACSPVRRTTQTLIVYGV